MPDYLRHRLNEVYDRFLHAAPDNRYATADENGWHFAADPSEKLDPASQRQLDELKDWLGQHMRWIKLPDLLIEVDNELGFTGYFMIPAQQQTRLPDDICTVLAAVMAHGCNIGLYTMAQLVSGIVYKQLKRVSDWQMSEETQRAALVELVSAISDLETSLSWGAGKTSFDLNKFEEDCKTEPVVIAAIGQYLQLCGAQRPVLSQLLVGPVALHENACLCRELG